ncbi:MAG: tRNA pseudouridine(55) synthase TruB [Bacillota bacterium]
MNGMIIVNKPRGLSSHDVVGKIRKIYKTKKVGHSGTLDIEASGVLVLGINKGTKILTYVNQDDKRYTFTIRFGQETDTLDHTGTIINTGGKPTLDDIKQAVASFPKTYSQTPPAYSAVKVGGKKLYQYARNNETIPVVPARDIVIYELTFDKQTRETDETVDVLCTVYASKGIYVRQLALDLARKLGTVAHTTTIHRTKAGPYTIEDAIPLDQITAETKLISMTDSLPNYPELIAPDDQLVKIKNGQKLPLNLTAPIIKIIDKNRQLLAIYEKHDTLYKAKNVFI